jgi:hypothetical protein
MRPSRKTLKNKSNSNPGLHKVRAFLKRKGIAFVDFSDERVGVLKFGDQKDPVRLQIQYELVSNRLSIIVDREDPIDMLDFINTVSYLNLVNVLIPFGNCYVCPCHNIIAHRFSTTVGADELSDQNLSIWIEGAVQSYIRFVPSAFDVIHGKVSVEDVIGEAFHDSPKVDENP